VVDDRGDANQQRGQADDEGDPEHGHQYERPAA
jgi:hypothetical protein